jgi:hypothetical protein
MNLRRGGARSLGTAWTAVAVATACDAPDVSMIVDVPAGAQSQAAWIEIGAFPNGCPPSGQLAGGLPPSGLAARVAFAADASPGGLGKLDTAVYGFAAVARRDDCGVLAAGCATVDVSHTRAIDISLDTSNDPDASACTNGLVCSNAQCVPPSGGDPNAGAGCSMVLVGAGPLPQSMQGGPFVSAPAIVALPSGGFVIVYEEYLALDGTDRLTVQPIDPSGGALDPSQPSIMGYCAGGTTIDAAGLAMGQNGGVAVVSRPLCMGQSGFELFELDPTGAVLKQSTSMNASPVGVALSTHALTPAATANRYLLAANVNGDATLLSTDGATVTPQTTTAFGTPQDTSARVVRTSSVVAVEVDGPSVGDAGATGSVGRVYLTAGGSDPTSLGSPVDQPLAAITALTALGNRAFLLTNGPGMGEDVAMFGYDLGAMTQPVVTGGFGAAQTTPLLALDAAAAQGRLFCALEQQDSVSIAVFNGASTTSPQLLSRIDLASDIRIPQSAHDGPIALAATDTSVAITWISHGVALDDGDTLGGYAVFACRP